MRLLISFFSFIGLLAGQSIAIYSGNGQIVAEQFLSKPFVVQATNSAGAPLAGVAVTWSIPANSGTLENATSTTDSNGLAQTTFLATTLPTGESFVGSTITASTSANSVTFFVTTSIAIGEGGAPPLVQLLTPSPGATVSGPAGGIIPGAIKVQVIAQSGYMSGQPIPNVGLFIPPPASSSGPSASCNAPAGTALTASNGIATCDLVLGKQTGSTPLSALVGEIQNTPIFTLQVTPAIACTYTISPASQSFGASGGGGVVNVVAGSSCGWVVAASASWIGITSATSGTGNGSVTYSVAANTGAARSGTLTIAGQRLTISQAGVSGPIPLTITTGASLPLASVGITYGSTLTATGGTPPYTWNATGTVPPGLIVNSNGLISGTPNTLGTFGFTVTVTDGARNSASQALTLTVAATGTGLIITNTSFPAGVIGQLYSQALTSTLGCTTPFTPAPIFRLSNGSLPPGLTLQSTSNSYAIAGTPTMAGSYPFTLSVEDACDAIATANFTIIISTTAAPTITAVPGSLVFTVQPASSTPPPSQTVQLTTASPVNYTASASTQSGGNWLVISNATGTTSTPTTGNALASATLTVSIANYSALAPATYYGTISIGSTGGNTSAVVSVALTVAVPASLNINPLNLAATLPNSGNTLTQDDIVFSSGTVSVGFVATATSEGGSWLYVSPTSGTSPATLIATLNAANLTAGTYKGVITLVTSYGNETVNVQLTVTAPNSLLPSPSALSFLSPAGAPAQTQALVVTSSNGTAQVTTTTSTTAGGSWLSVTPGSGTTPLSLTVSADPGGLSAGTYAGLVSVTPSDKTIPIANIPVTLTVEPAAPAITAITNAASFVPGDVAPGELITIFGTLMGPATLAASELNSSGGLVTTLAGTQVLFDGTPAPLIYTSAGQVAAIVPYEIAGNASTVVQVVYQGVLSNAVNLRVTSANPAIFTLNSQNQGAILNQDGSINSSGNGAEPGSIVSIYATGGGQLKPAGVDGQITSPTSLSTTVLATQVEIAGQTEGVLYAGDAPGLASGVLQVNAQVPSSAAHGTQVPVILMVGSAASLPVQMWVK